MRELTTACALADNRFMMFIVFISPSPREGSPYSVLWGPLAAAVGVGACALLAAAAALALPNPLIDICIPFLCVHR